MSTRLSSLLVQDGLVSAKRVADALQRQVIHGGTLDSNLLDIKAIEEDTLITYLGRACGLPTQPTGIVASGVPQPAVLELFTDQVAQRFHAVPTTLLTGGVLQVLVTDEVEISDMDTLALTVKQRIEPWVIFEFRFAEAMDKVYGKAMATRMARLLTRSIAAHDGQGKGWPAPRLIDPIPRFGSLSDLRLPGPPPPVAEVKPAPVVEPPAPVAEAKPAVVEPVAEIKPAPVAEVKPAVVEPVAEVKPAPVAEVKAAPVVEVKAAPVAEVKAAPVVEVKPTPVVEVKAAPVVEVKPAPVVEVKAAPVVEVKPAPVVEVKAAPVAEVKAAPVVEVKPAVVEPVAEVKPAPVAEVKPAVVEPAAPVAPTRDPAAPQLSSASGSFAGIEDISLDEWMSAADWLSAANKVPPAESAAAAATAPAAPAPAAAAPAAAAPAVTSAPTSAAKPAAVAPVAQTAAKPAATPAAPPSSASPGKRKGKNKRGKEVPPVAAKPTAPSLPAVTVTAPAKTPAPIVTTPVAPAVTPAATPPVAAKPVAAAAQSKPAVAPVQPAKPRTTQSQPIISAASSQPAAPVAAKPAAPVAPVAPLPGVITPPTPVTPPPAATVESARTPETAPPAFVEAVPLAVDSSDQVSKVLAAPVDAVPPPSSESPLPEIGPAPRVAVALDEAGGDSPISLEAARELVSAATERDPIFEAVCRGIRSRVAFAAVFTIHGEVAFGRMALGETWLDRQTVGRVSVQLDRTSAFRAVAKGRLPFVGFVGEEAAAGDPLRALDRRPPQAAAVLPILVRGKPVALVYFDDEGREVSTQLAEELQPLISEIGQSFQRFLQSSKSGGLGASDGDELAPQEVQDTGTSALRPRESRVETAPAPTPVAEQPTTRLEKEPPSQVKAQEAAPAVQLHALPTMPLKKGEEKPAAKPEAKPEAKVETKTEAKPEAKVETKPEAKAETKAETRGSKAGRGKSQKSPPSSAASPTTPAPTKGAIATTDLSALLEKAATAPRDPSALRDILLVGQSAVKPLIEKLKDTATSAKLRLVIVRCLAEMPVQAALEVLGERLLDSDEEVRTAAGVALRGFPPSSALSALRSRTRDALEGSDVKGVQHAVEALGELRDTQAVPQLIDLLDHSDPRVVDAVGRSLQSITKQDFGRSRFRWAGWWRRHQAEPRLQWLLEGLSHPSALIRQSSQDELFDMSGDVASYRYDQPSSERDQAARRWVDWWQSHGYDVV